MPLDITFTLSDQDLAHFRQIVEKANSAMQGEKTAEQIEAAAKQLIAKARSGKLPDFIADRLAKLDTVINMIGDSEWGLAAEERTRILGALIYLCDPEDLIPDHVPGLGFLDDAIYAELVIRELKSEIDSYEEFCEFRSKEEKRRAQLGQDTRVERDAWLADKRVSLQQSMRKRRLSAATRRISWLFKR